MEADIKLVVCQMTVELFGHSHDDFIPEIKDLMRGQFFAGGATVGRLPVCLTRINVLHR